MMCKQKKIESGRMRFFSPGLIVLLLSFAPFFLLGTDAVVPYHDQLDGEIIAYILRAKYLFSGGDSIPEFLNGMAKTSLIPPAPVGVLFFSVLPPFWAYLGLQISGQVSAYGGMYFLLEKMGIKGWIGTAVSLLYAFLTFLPVYGLTQYGLPLLFLCAWNLYENRHIKGSLLGVAFYAGFSSFVLCGYGCLLLWGGILCALFLQKKLRRHTKFAYGFILLSGIYGVENFSLFLQMFGAGEQSISHKAEYAIAENGFFTQFAEYFLKNDEHSADYHVWILAVCVPVVLCYLFYRKRMSSMQKTYFSGIVKIGMSLMVLYAFAALWSSRGVVAFRSHFGALGAFRAERVVWLTPVMWYVILALALSLICTGENRWLWIRMSASGLVLAFIGASVMKGSFVKPCVQKLVNPEYGAMSWSDYYADGVMEQAADYIFRTTGLRQEEYKVVSLGIDPAAALYHGFYCLDGYSNNYSLAYKQVFRQVIEKELQKSPYLQDYFDNWGNRCYLFAAEIPGYYNIEKGSFWYQDLELNTDVLSRLGCRYILSAAYIVGSEEMNLRLLEEVPFATKNSYYCIYLYEIADDTDVVENNIADRSAM